MFLAGKSSLLQALFRYANHKLHRKICSLISGVRIVELKSGVISIDGVNCREIGLDVLRRQLAVIPQDSVLL
jgi:ABC-type transport system involved in Fe-S cluster assembly fused permease/ATPase subunit